MLTINTKAIVGRVGRVRQVGQVRQMGQVRRVGQVRLVGRLGGLRRLGVRAKASECMELGMWGRLWDRWDKWAFFCFCGLSFVICNYFVSLSLEIYNSKLIIIKNAAFSDYR